MNFQIIVNFLQIASSSYVPLLITECIAIPLKTYILCVLTKRGFNVRPRLPLFFILCVLIGSITEDCAWVIKALNVSFSPAMPYPFIVFAIRLAWAMSLVQWQSLSLFLESLIKPAYRITWHQYMRLAAASFFACGFVYFMTSGINTQSPYDRSALEYFFMELTGRYICPFLLLLPSLFIIIYQVQFKPLPRILRLQVLSFIKYIIVPRLVLEIWQSYSYFYHPNANAFGYIIVIISPLLTTYLIYYSARKFMALRFLNLSPHVGASAKFSIANHIKDIIEPLSHVSSEQELASLTKAFFKQALHIPPGRTSIFFKNCTNTPTNDLDRNPIAASIEQFIAQKELHPQAAEHLHKTKILIFDEIEFSHFYDPQPVSAQLLAFMQSVSADVFVPIYDHNTLIGYIMIERDARSNELYSDLERDEIIVFASFVSNLIILLQNRTLEALLASKKYLKDELYQKHQEVNQYKESIRSFLCDNDHKKIGILFYKNRSFIFGNQSAKELIGINPTVQSGHPLAQQLKHLVQEAHLYKTTQTNLTRDTKGDRLVITAIPNLEANNIIIVVHHPDISDVLAKQMQFLNDPSDWDYLLYLETTHSGKLINQLIPGSHKNLVNLKVKLLKCALCKKPLLLCMADKDLMDTVELLHHLSLRETLSVLTPETTKDASNIGFTIFGVNPLFGNSFQRPLLETLNGNGTIFIKNIHKLDIPTQQRLAYYFKYGVYQPYKSDQKLRSETRIICSSPLCIRTLVKENKFLPELYEEIKDNTLEIPTLLGMNDDELSNLADEYAAQSVETQELHNLLSLNDKDKLRLLHKKAVSLKEFKHHIKSMLDAKSRKHHIEQIPQNTLVDSSLDPLLIQAARLGKRALRDSAMMEYLWNKFKNQNKIATFLGVNRSSINRRCKEFNLT